MNELSGFYHELTSQDTEYFTTSDSLNCELTSINLTQTSTGDDQITYTPNNGKSGSISVNISEGGP